MSFVIKIRVSEMRNLVFKIAVFSTFENLVFLLMLGPFSGVFLHRQNLGSFLSRSKLIKPQSEFDLCFEPFVLEAKKQAIFGHFAFGRWPKNGHFDNFSKLCLFFRKLGICFSNIVRFFAKENSVDLH